MPEVSTIKGTGAQNYSSCLLGKALISVYLAQITLLYLACELHRCWLGFSYMFNKNASVLDRFPTGGQLCAKLPTVTSVLQIH